MCAPALVIASVVLASAALPPGAHSAPVSAASDSTARGIEEAAQSARTSPLRVVVMDQTGLVIVGATVRATAADGTVSATVTDERGEARLDLPAGEYVVDVESVGFEPAQFAGQRLRGGGLKREVILAIAGLVEEVEVGRDPQEVGADPNSGAFGTTLSQDQMDALPDDPDQLEAALQQMAGPGAQFRVNGFRNSGLPPKSQIREIRFRQNAYAADTHEASNFSVDITTQPGRDNWRTSFNVGFRDDAMDARNAFATTEPNEQQRRGSFSIDGPLWRNKTSVELNVDGFDAFDTKPIVATTLQGPYTGSIQRPSERSGVRVGIDHGLTRTQTLRVEFDRRNVQNDSLGIGDLDLPERAYSRTNEQSRFAFRLKGPLGKRFLNDVYFEGGWRALETVPDSYARAVRVQGAFNGGGAQTQGGRDSFEFELGQNLDFVSGKHTVRGGYLYERGDYTSDELRNGGGTFTFSSLSAWEAATATTYTQRIGDPLVSYDAWRAAWFVQDDYKVRKDLTVSFGLRHEFQQYVDSLWNLAPRAGFAWSPFRSGRTTFRGGAGVFYDWMDTNVYEETLQVDGERLQDVVVRDPSYPNPIVGGFGEIQPSGRVQLADSLEMPTIRQASFGVEHTFSPQMRLNATYRFRDGENLLRGRNVNAPDAAGNRPEPNVGTVTEVQSIGEARSHQMIVGFNTSAPNGRFFVGGNYTWTFARDDGSGATSLPADSIDPDEWGPSMEDIRHRVSTFFSLRLTNALRFGGGLRVESAPPYNITTGRDDNGDSIFNDRPAGVDRNAGRGDQFVDLNLRLGYTFGFGTRKDTGTTPAGGGPGGGPPMRMGGGGRGGPGMGGGGPMDRTKVVSFEAYVSATNVLNNVNYSGYTGVITSPYFGQPTSARAPRRIEIGMRMMF
jgi:hypothetical protein